MIGKCVSTERMTARTAPTRDGASKPPSAAGAPSRTSPAAAASTVVLTLAMVLAAGCGGSEPRAGFVDPERLERAVLRDAEQRLMTSNPREPGAGSATHVREVACRSSGARRFRCTIRLARGRALVWLVRVSAEGRSFAVVRTGVSP